MGVRSDIEITPGSIIRFVLPSWATAGARKQPIDHVFEYRGAHSLTDSGAITQLPTVHSRLMLPEMETLLLPLDPSLFDEPFTIAIRGIDPFGTDGWQIRLLDESGSVVAFDRGGNSIPLIAPRETEQQGEGPLQLRVPALSVTGPLSLEIDPPGEPSMVSDATLFLRVER